MATAFLNPIDRARVERRQSQIERLNSIDPVTRYKAKEEALADAVTSFSKGVVQKAKQAEKEYLDIERKAERAEREYYKFKPLPQGVKTIPYNEEKTK